MRETQIVGLPEGANKFLKKNVELIPYIVCPDCGKVCTTREHTEIYKDERSAGMFHDGPMLKRYFLKDGRKVIEQIQASPWSSGPCIFLRLIDEATTEVLYDWDNELMHEYL